MKGVGMLFGNFELNPERRPIWAWAKPFLTPKKDHVKTQTNQNSGQRRLLFSFDVIENLDYMNGVNKTN